MRKISGRFFWTVIAAVLGLVVAIAILYDPLPVDNELVTAVVVLLETNETEDKDLVAALADRGVSEENIFAIAFIFVERMAWRFERLKLDNFFLDKPIIPKEMGLLNPILKRIKRQCNFEKKFLMLRDRLNSRKFTLEEKKKISKEMENIKIEQQKFIEQYRLSAYQEDLKVIKFLTRNVQSLDFSWLKRRLEI